MKIATARRGGSLYFSITPMIDVVFLLIIFFLVSTHFVQSETLETVALPEATQFNDQNENQPQRLVITVTAEGAYSINSRIVPWTELEAIILSHENRDKKDQEREVRIRADQAALYQSVKPILLTCAQAKISKVSFSVMPAGQ